MPGNPAVNNRADVSPGGVLLTPQLIWQNLTSSGLSSVQAAGVFGNMIAESSLNPENVTNDSNGYRSYGLFQFNAQSYPGAASLVTGDPVADSQSQISYFLQVVPKSALDGTTPAEVASNVATQFERCQTCGAGGTSNTQRQAYATSAAGWAQAGSWPSDLGTAIDSATLSAASKAQQTSTCLVGLNFPLFGQACFLSRSQARALLAGGILIAGGLLALFAVSSLTGISLPGGAIGGALAGSVKGPTGAAVGAVTGASRAREESAQERHTARQYSRQRRARENYARDAERDRPPF